MVQAQSPSDLLALRYATQEPRPAADAFTTPQAEDGPVAFDYFFWLLRGPRPIVIDCGFDGKTATARKRRLLHEPGSLLKAAEVDPAAVETVVLTHLHYDHAGCLDLFPNATFVVQAAEVAHVTGPAMAQPSLRQHYIPEQIQRFLAITWEGRVRHVEGEHELAPGVTLHHLPGHTPGHQVVRVETAGGPKVLASDALHLYANLRRRNPFPIHVDLPASFAAFDRLLALGGGPDGVVPGHDPEVAERYPALRETPDIVRLGCG